MMWAQGRLFSVVLPLNPVLFTILFMELQFYVVSRHGIRKPADPFLWMYQLHGDFSLGFSLPFLLLLWQAAMGHLQQHMEYR